MTGADAAGGSPVAGGVGGTRGRARRAGPASGAAAVAVAAGTDADDRQPLNTVANCGGGS